MRLGLRPVWLRLVTNGTRPANNLLPKCLLDFEVMLVETGVDQLDIITNLVRIKRGYLHTVVNVDEIR